MIFFDKITSQAIEKSDVSTALQLPSSAIMTLIKGI